MGVGTGEPFMYAAARACFSVHSGIRAFLSDGAADPGLH